MRLILRLLQGIFWNELILSWILPSVFFPCVRMSSSNCPPHNKAKGIISWPWYIHGLHASWSLIWAASWFTDGRSSFSSMSFLLLLSLMLLLSSTLSILFCVICSIFMFHSVTSSSLSLTFAHSCNPYRNLDVHKLSATFLSLITLHPVIINEVWFYFSWLHVVDQFNSCSISMLWIKQYILVPRPSVTN